MLVPLRLLGVLFLLFLGIIPALLGIDGCCNHDRCQDSCDSFGILMTLVAKQRDHMHSSKVAEQSRHPGPQRCRVIVFVIHDVLRLRWWPGVNSYAATFNTTTRRPGCWSLRRNDPCSAR